MTPEGLSALVAFALALFFAYFPWVAKKYQALDPDIKRLCMAGFLIVASGIIYGLECLGWYDTAGVVCTQPGLLEFGKILFAAIVANQGTFPLLPKVGPNA